MVWHDFPPEEYNKKGDLTTSTADGKKALLSVGANGDFLIPNSANDNGLEWVTLVHYEDTPVLLDDEFVYI